MLASLGGRGDADDLAWTTLQNQDVADADVVTRDGDGVGRHVAAIGPVAAAAAAVADAFGALGVAWSTGLNFAVLDLDILLTLYDTITMVVVWAAVDRMQDAFGSAVQSVTEGMVLAVFVVVSHIRAVLVSFAGSVVCTLFDVDFFVESDTCPSSSVVAWIGALVFVSAGTTVLFGKWNGAVSVISFGYVDTSVQIDLGSWGVADWVLAVVLVVFDVNLGVGVALVRLTVAVE